MKQDVAVINCLVLLWIAHVDESLSFTLSAVTLSSN